MPRHTNAGSGIALLDKPAVAPGVQHNFAKGFSLDVSTGYIFHRFFYESRGFSDQDQNRLDVGDGVYLMERLQTRF